MTPRQSGTAIDPGCPGSRIQSGVAADTIFFSWGTPVCMKWECCGAECVLSVPDEPSTSYCVDDRNLHLI